jgi:hypothetical protein
MVLAAKQVIGALGTKLLMQSLPRRIRSETPDPLHFFRIVKEQPSKKLKTKCPAIGAFGLELP